MKDNIEIIKRYHRLTNYISAAQIYLQDNFLLEKPLKPQHIKDRLLGHWWTVPGLNFIYAFLNDLICKTKSEMVFVTGPGHWFPAIQSNLFVEWSLSHFYKQIPYNKKWLFEIIKQFSWPYWYPSHLNPWAPWCILEWWELGYSLSTSFWAVFDNPDLIVACVIWDGEAETASINAAWHSVKYLNPKTSWAVLPIIHQNWYKISWPTVYSMMSDDDLKSYFHWLWYEALIVEEKKWSDDVYSQMLVTLDYAYKNICKIQSNARLKWIINVNTKWPVIILKSPKWWTTIKEFEWNKLEWNSDSHQVVFKWCKKNPDQLKLIEKWFKSYKVEELIDENWIPESDLQLIIPQNNFCMWMSKYANNGIKDVLNIPNIKNIEHKIMKSKTWLSICKNSSMKTAWEYLKQVFQLNERLNNFRLFSPDETYSNRIDKVFDITSRTYLKKPKKWEKDLSPDWRVMEMLSENTLQWWLEWYLLTWRHWLFVSYEAFIQIVASMVDQYGKFMYQSKEIPWRKPLSSLNYILSSLWWRQDHNGFSHQNPWFISGLLDKHWDYISIYFPVDSNSMLACLDEISQEKDNINVIIAWKNPSFQWLSLTEAKKQLDKWLWIWESLSDKKPDIVLASCWDYVSDEMIEWMNLVREYLPSIKLRYVNVCKLTAFGIGTERKSINQKEFDQFFTSSKPVIFNHHWYAHDIMKLIFWYKWSNRFVIWWYKEEGSTTTPIDMFIRNWVSRYHVVLNVCNELLNTNISSLMEKKIQDIKTKAENKLLWHREFIITHWVDPKEEEMNNLR